MSVRGPPRQRGMSARPLAPDEAEDCTPSAPLLTRNVNPQRAPQGEDKVRGTAQGKERLVAGCEGRPQLSPPHLSPPHRRTRSCPGALDGGLCATCPQS